MDQRMGGTGLPTATLWSAINRGSLPPGTATSTGHGYCGGLGIVPDLLPGLVAVLT